MTVRILSRQWGFSSIDKVAGGLQEFTLRSSTSSKLVLCMYNTVHPGYNSSGYSDIFFTAI